MLFIKKLLPIEKTKWMFFGQQRSGHHAIMSWILKNQEYTHFNICQFKNNIYSDDIIGKINNCVVASFEGQIPDYDWNSLISKKCLVLRNPYNMYASRLAMKRASLYHNLKSWENCLNPQEWLQHAKEFLSQTSILGSCTKIIYDYWFDIRDYRDRLADVLGLPSSELPEKITNFGGGSSFDKITQNATSMNVLNRWKEFEFDEEFKEILFDEDIKNYWKEIESSTKFLL